MPRAGESIDEWENDQDGSVNVPIQKNIDSLNSKLSRVSGGNETTKKRRESYESSEGLLKNFYCGRSNGVDCKTMVTEGCRKIYRSASKRDQHTKVCKHKKGAKFLEIRKLIETITEPEPEPEPETDGVDVEVEEVVIDGESYYKDEDGTLYDMDTNEELGKLGDGKLLKNRL